MRKWEKHSDIYPLTIVQMRYGGKYVAFSVEADNELIWDVQYDEETSYTVNIFLEDNFEGRYGIGETINDALDDLIRRHNKYESEISERSKNVDPEKMKNLFLPISEFLKKIIVNSTDLVSVQPMTEAPKGSLFYIDVTSGPPEYERYKKYEGGVRLDENNLNEVKGIFEQAEIGDVITYVDNIGPLSGRVYLKLTRNEEQVGYKTLAMS